MHSQRPYLFDAIYQWILDNCWTPYLLVDAETPEVIVPKHLVQDGHIVLNIAPAAIANYTKSDMAITFSARFSGKSEFICVPFASMKGLYAKENSQGLLFPADLIPPQPEENAKQHSKKESDLLEAGDGKIRKSGLKIVK